MGGVGGGTLPERLAFLKPLKVRLEALLWCFGKTRKVSPRLSSLGDR